MQSLRRQVDQIDRKILQILQKRTKFSAQIGRMKHRHGAVVYVPERERELIARLVQLSKGKLSPCSVAALYREILSSSRAAQGQMPIGLLKASAPAVLPSGYLAFGACDEFLVTKTWSELVKGLDRETLSLALVTGSDLMDALQAHRSRNEFLERFMVVGQLSTGFDPKASLEEKIFVVTPRQAGAAFKADRILILIECKSTVNAIKTLLRSMPDFSLHSEHLTHHLKRGTDVTLVHLTLPRRANSILAANRLHAACQSKAISLSILGVYPSTINYGGR
jgi:chorismate mutase